MFSFQFDMAKMTAHYSAFDPKMQKELRKQKNPFRTINANGKPMNMGQILGMMPAKEYKA